MNNEQWLESLAEGDTVILDSNRRLQAGVITRMTATQFIVTTTNGAGNYETRFNRNRGKRLGDSGSWDHCWLRPATPDKLLTIETRDLIEKLTCVSKDTLSKLPVETLREAAKLLSA